MFLVDLRRVTVALDWPYTVPEDQLLRQIEEKESSEDDHILSRKDFTVCETLGEVDRLRRTLHIQGLPPFVLDCKDSEYLALEGLGCEG